jgi:hypothetical protein
MICIGGVYYGLLRFDILCVCFNGIFGFSCSSSPSNIFQEGYEEGFFGILPAFVIGVFEDSLRASRDIVRLKRLLYYVLARDFLSR